MGYFLDFYLLVLVICGQHSLSFLVLHKIVVCLIIDGIFENLAPLVLYAFIYFWLCWVFVAKHGLSLAAVMGATLSCSV